MGVGLEAPSCSLTCPCLAGDGDMEQIDFIDSHVPGEDEERSAAEVRTQLRPLSRGRALNKEVTANWGTSLPQPLLVSLQEQLPSELSPVAGDVERTWSSRYSNPQAHMSAPYSTARGPPLHLTKVSLALSSARREEPAGEERRRPDTLQLWQERERRQQQSGGWGSPRRDR